MMTLLYHLLSIVGVAMVGGGVVIGDSYFLVIGAIFMFYSETFLSREEARGAREELGALRDEIAKQRRKEEI